MAYTSGTATNYKDLLSILYTFATANGWVGMEQSETRIYLKGTGTAGLDEIYCGIETYENSSNGYYNWELFGSASWRAGRTPQSHPLSTGDDRVFSYLWNSSIPYWIVSTPRRVMGFAKIGTNYTCFHLGLLIPPATDAQYPYPLFIGGCGDVKAQSYATATGANSGFWSASSSVSNGLLRLPGGEWLKSGATLTNSVMPIWNTHHFRSSISSGIDGSYMLDQIYLVAGYYYLSAYGGVNTQATYGAIDGLFWVSGQNNSAENIIVVDGVNYMVFPDVFRASRSDYCAMRLN